MVKSNPQLNIFPCSPPTGGQEAVIMWFVYTLYNQDANKIYIGETRNLEKRIEEHNRKRGNHFTAKFNGEWRLIYQEEVLDRKQALMREKQLKSFRGREFVKTHI